MRVRHSEGVASRTGPEPCVDIAVEEAENLGKAPASRGSSGDG